MNQETSAESVLPFKITLDITQADESSECATMIDVNATAWCIDSCTQVAACHGNLIKREMMSDPLMFPYVMEVTSELEEVAKEYEIFDLNLDGTMVPKAMVDYFERLGLFPEKDYATFQKSKNIKDHPCNRAWILYFNTLTVDEAFRRRNIGWTVVRTAMEAAWKEATVAGRPLLAGVRPGFLGPKGGVEADSEQFWQAMGFKRYSVHFQPDLFFWGWGVQEGLPDVKPIGPKIAEGS